MEEQQQQEKRRTSQRRDFSTGNVVVQFVRSLINCETNKTTRIYGQSIGRRTTTRQDSVRQVEVERMNWIYNTHSCCAFLPSSCSRFTVSRAPPFLCIVEKTHRIDRHHRYRKYFFRDQVKLSLSLSILN